MPIFDRVPANFTPGSMFQMGRGLTLVPAGKNAQSGQFLVSNGNGDWVPASLGWKYIPIPGGTYTCTVQDFATVNQLITVNGTATINLPPVAQPRMEIFVVVTQNNVTCTVQTQGASRMLTPDGTFQGFIILSTPPAGGGFTRLHLISDGLNWFVVNEAGGTMRTDGDMLVRNQGHLQAIPKGTTGQFLRQGAAIPAWATLDATMVGGWYFLQKSANYTVTAADIASQNLIVYCSVTATITLPNPATSFTQVVVMATGTATVTVNSAAGGAFVLPDGLVASVVLSAPFQSIHLTSGGSGNWVVLSHDNVLTADGDLMTRQAGHTTRQAQGVWVTVPFTATDYTATTGTWTVTAGNLINLSYVLFGKTMTVAWQINASTLSASTSTMSILIPAGKVAARNMFAGSAWILDGTGQRACRVGLSAGSTNISFFPADGSNFAAGVNNVFPQGQMTFETT